LTKIVGAVAEADVVAADEYADKQVDAVRAVLQQVDQWIGWSQLMSQLTPEAQLFGLADMG